MLSARARQFGETIFSEITARALEHQAVNLGQGFPDFPPSPFVIEAAARAARGDAQQYARGAGAMELVSAVADQAASRLDRRPDPEREVTITAGATEALLATILALVDPGDEVVLIDPFFDCYPSDVSLAGGVARHLALQPEGDGWRLDLDELATLMGPRTKLLVLNTPHNPTGKVFSVEELERIAELCLQYDVYVLADEVYEELYFSGQHGSIAALPGMWDRTVTISSAGKTFSVTGWKVGWAIAPAPLSVGIRRIHQWTTFSVASTLQSAVAEMLGVADASGYYRQLRATYGRKRELLLGALADTPLRAIAPEGTYFVMADISESGFDTGVAFCHHLIKEVGVAAIPASVFYSGAHQEMGSNFVRFCFCKEDATLEVAARRLASLAGG